ncbi:LysR family transcriptional regulator [Ralstonia insidiosa]|jgi:DNA-binding transcriptional LysR family regulator|nr:LysR family transcriptional regulator [Ralstonia insidiosa]KMW45008.1 hypothetical protein AC240_22380 [Ralstonia sp. MD27]MBX3774086.1 LysR family transcriptional regulator [Ralstonia pickettii]NOZ17784.1 LysR family transcriptional regulator [Betaproteobacteria bacterium]MBA9857921.1 LysR family transcriptional regulator [Ralstonia insidiosa]MBA9871657.1 LysR family transcriptional regulator [Ralstonia insidiosa]
MSGLNFSLAQIEAFATVAELGSISKAATTLAKDRSTLSELIAFLEDDLGYALFERNGRNLALTQAGLRLQRQAKLLLRSAHAFGEFATGVAQDFNAEISLAYDPFVPRERIAALVDRAADRGIRLSAWSTCRIDAEDALKSGQADLAISLARNHSIGGDMQWYGVGTIDMALYAAESFFHTSPVALAELASKPQILMHRALDEQQAKLLRISDRVLLTNEVEMVGHMLDRSHGWAFLPTHLRMDQWPNVRMIVAEIGTDGLSQTLVALWKPGRDREPAVRDVLDALTAK